MSNDEQRDKTAIVTGGGGSIGTSISVRLAQEGNAVVIAQRTEKSAIETVDRIKELGGDATFIQTDVSSEEDIEALVKKTVAEYETVDIVVNNAANPRKEWAKKMQEEFWEDVVSTNLSGPFKLAQKTYQHMESDGYGRIINISAIQAFSPLSGAVAYASSKAGLEGLTRSLAAEWSSPNLTVNAVQVGPVYSSDWVDENNRASRVPVEEEYENPPTEIDSNAATLVDRIGRPSDIASLVAFLAHPDSGFITGATIPCDGGRLLSRESEPYDQTNNIK